MDLQSTLKPAKIVKQILSTVPNSHPIRTIVHKTEPNIDAMVKNAEKATTRLQVAPNITTNADFDCQQAPKIQTNAGFSSFEVVTLV